MLQANIKARKEVLRNTPKPKPRKRSRKNAPADPIQLPPQFFNVKGSFDNMDFRHQ